ncbi:AraC family ligand binding domain-containing protein [Scatolibacter rhodanostii]|uniref:AraC family ligand binding domain-containing protein n=1 Tax=Scatolibacter rhodanostii TaxID=2014781 RepID=UPI000C0883EB|nr:AraC family transcriptional regulator [Scatolibacter rhodanostii]
MSYFHFECSDTYVHHTLDEIPDKSSFPMHVHEHNELYLFLKGRCSFFVEGRRYPLVPGSLILLRAGETHRIQILEDTPYERMAIHFSDRLISEVDPQMRILNTLFHGELGKNNLYDPKQFNTHLIHNALLSISKSGRNKELDEYEGKMLIRCNLLPVLYELCKNTNQHKAEPIKSYADSAVTKAISYINANLTKELSLSQIAELCFSEKSYLNNQFKKFTGSTIWDYIIIKRLMLARQLIKDGVSASAAAYSSGWKDYSSFYRQYKAKFGVHPSCKEKNIYIR